MIHSRTSESTWQSPQRDKGAYTTKHRMYAIYIELLGGYQE